jgi:hypothetical protein
VWSRRPHIGGWITRISKICGAVPAGAMSVTTMQSNHRNTLNLPLCEALKGVYSDVRC